MNMTMLLALQPWHAQNAVPVYSALAKCLLQAAPSLFMHQSPGALKFLFLTQEIRLYRPCCVL